MVVFFLPKTMKIFQTQLFDLKDWVSGEIPFTPDMIFLFVSPSFAPLKELLQVIYREHPKVICMGCSTAGEILGNQVFDHSVALTAVTFEHTRLRSIVVDLKDCKKDSYAAGRSLATQLASEDLRHIFVLSDGLSVNGAELVKGVQEHVPSSVSITGGLAGDGYNFGKTFVIHNQEVCSNTITALGLYGKDLKIGYGSRGGWDSFGIERLVTRSKDNVLYELDGVPALELYKTFLGDKAKDLPISGLLFPLSMRDDDSIPVVRTILSVNEEDQSLTFAGNIPQGSYVRLMKANVDRIINGAEQSALVSKEGTDHHHQLAFLISCVGRRLVMKQLVEEELEVVNEVFDNSIYATGFYSYGEIAPFNRDTPCALHNQTMTITTFSE